MFHNKNTTPRALVALTYRDGRNETVSVRLPLSAKLNDALNSGDLFLDVLNAAEKQYFVAKADVVRVELMEVPKADQINLQRRATDRERFDPYRVLGVEAGADAEAVRQAYLSMIKAYHPDRFVAVELPREMRAYLNAMVARINLAYEQIGL